MDKLINRTPELNCKFKPITEGICKFNVYETLHTVIYNSPTQLLVDSGLYYDNITGQCYILSEYDIRRLLQILNRFINECLNWLIRNDDKDSCFDQSSYRENIMMVIVLIAAIYGCMEGFVIAAKMHTATIILVITEIIYFIIMIKYFKGIPKETCKDGRRESKILENRRSCM